MPRANVVDILFINNTNWLRAFLKNAKTNAYLTDGGGATVVVTLLDSNGAEVTGATWPLSLSYVPASEGEWDASLPSTLSLIPRDSYIALIEINDGSGVLSEIRFRLTAQYKTE
jgi:hypothetical protein